MIPKLFGLLMAITVSGCVSAPPGSRPSAITYTESNTVQMTALESLFKVCGSINGLAKSIDMEDQTLLPAMLGTAYNKGVMDEHQLRMLKINFQTGQIEHLNKYRWESEAEKIQAKLNDGPKVKQTLEVCRKLTTRGALS